MAQEVSPGHKRGRVCLQAYFGPVLNAKHVGSEVFDIRRPDAARRAVVEQELPFAQVPAVQSDWLMIADWPDSSVVSFPVPAIDRNRVGGTTRISIWARPKGEVSRWKS